MAENDVTIEINVDAKDAQKAIDEFGKESSKALRNTEKQSSNFFNTFKLGALRLAGPIAAAVGGFAAIKKGITDAVEEATLTRRIEASLLAVGNASEEAVKGVIDFADNIKNTTGLSDDLVKSLFITAQSFGTSTEKAKELTLAAIDLAAATGESADTAVKLLGATLKGTAGRVEEFGEEFRNLTKEQLEAGVAIDLVSKKFSGTAAKDLDSFSGRISQLTNSFGDFVKEIGKTVTESDLVQGALKATAESIDEVTEALKRSKQEEESRDFSFGASILGASAAYIQAAENIRLTNEQLAAFRDINIGGQSKAVAEGFAGIVEQSQGASSATADFITRLKSFPAIQSKKNLEITGKALEELKKKLETSRKEFERFQSGILSGRGTEQEKILQKQKDDLTALNNFAKQSGVASSKEISDLRIKINEDTANQLFKINKDSADEFIRTSKEAADKIEADEKAALEKRRQNYEESFINPVKTAIQGLFGSEGINQEQVAGAVLGGVNLALQGKEGAKKFLADTAGAVADFFLPGIGGLVSQVTSLLAAGPEEVKKLITEFIKYIPEFIVAIADAIPVVVEALIDTLLFKGGLERIVGSLLRAVPRIAERLAQTLINAVTEGSGVIGQKIGEFFAESLDSIFKPIQGLFDPLTDALITVREAIWSLYEPIFDLIDSLTGGSTGDFFASLDPTQFFKKGGLVYAADGYFQPRGTDTVPAMLSPGELVVPRDMVSELGAFLNSQRSEAPGSDAAMLSAIYSAVSGPIVVKAEAKVKEQAFADIILQLNRQNARLRA